MESYRLKGSYAIILGSSASNQVHTAAVKHREIGLLFHLSLRRARNLALSSFYHKGGQKVIIRVARNESKGVYMERLHLISLVDRRFGSL